MTAHGLDVSEGKPKAKPVSLVSTSGMEKSKQAKSSELANGPKVVKSLPKTVELVWVFLPLN
jgi:hypothetical protein